MGHDWETMGKRLETMENDSQRWETIENNQDSIVNLVCIGQLRTIKFTKQVMKQEEHDKQRKGENTMIPNNNQEDPRKKVEKQEQPKDS